MHSSGVAPTAACCCAGWQEGCVPAAARPACTPALRMLRRCCCCLELRLLGSLPTAGCCRAGGMAAAGWLGAGCWGCGGAAPLAGSSTRRTAKEMLPTSAPVLGLTRRQQRSGSRWMGRRCAAQGPGGPRHGSSMPPLQQLQLPMPSAAGQESSREPTPSTVGGLAMPAAWWVGAQLLVAGGPPQPSTQTRCSGNGEWRLAAALSSPGSPQLPAACTMCIASNRTGEGPLQLLCPFTEALPPVAEPLPAASGARHRAVQRRGSCSTGFPSSFSSRVWWAGEAAAVSQPSAAAACSVMGKESGSYAPARHRGWPNSWG